MRKLSVVKTMVAALVLSASASMAQDVSINVISQRNGVNDGAWPKNAPVGTVAILVSICNNDGGSTNVPSYKLRPLISVPSAIVKVAPAASQTGLPQGWTILTQTDGTIRLSNGTDQIPPAECRDFPIFLETVAEGAPLTVTATMGFANGQAPGSVSGPQTPGNNPANDNSTTAVQVLPVKLISFTAKKEGSVTQLAWATSEETNSHRFDVQRSSDGRNWAEIGTVESHGESVTLKRYNYTDPEPLAGRNLYRLKMVDLDGMFAYSRIVSVGLDGGLETSIYPNPVREKLNVKVSDWKMVKTVQIYNLQGVSVYSVNSPKSDTIDLSNLPDGMYLLHITHTDGAVRTHKFVHTR